MLPLLFLFAVRSELEYQFGCRDIALIEHTTQYVYLLCCALLAIDNEPIFGSWLNFRHNTSEEMVLTLCCNRGCVEEQCVQS